MRILSPRSALCTVDYLHSGLFATSLSSVVKAVKEASDFAVDVTHSWTRRAAIDLNALVKGPWLILHCLGYLLLHSGLLITH